jgi:formate dehydrogenase maturation protein FdhE
MNVWQQRATRARFLARSFPASQEILFFYAHVAEWQGSVSPKISSFDELSSMMPSLLEIVRRTAPTSLARAAQDFDISRTAGLLRQYWESPGAASAEEFFARALLQPYAASLPEGLDCTWCLRAPQAGSLRPQGNGLAFELVCALCFRRRSFPRARCPACDETAESRIASFTAPEFPHLRLLACETCKAYLVIVDLEKDFAAIPEVDELAALPMALWAVDQGYHKLQPNLAGV